MLLSVCWLFWNDVVFSRK